MNSESVEADGTIRNGMRRESDSLGGVWVPADRYWGAETERSLAHFSIGNERLPGEVIRELALLKKAAALANLDLGRLTEDEVSLIVRAAEEVAEGKLDGNFPLPVWTSGSGTHFNMNVNEVVANRAIEMAGGTKGTKSPIHPNDHVNRSQSTNDIFPSAMYMATVRMIHERLVPMVRKLGNALDEKAQAWADIPKIGRTHMMDAVPMTLGQEFSGYAAMLDDDLGRIAGVLSDLYRLPVGGTAVGTGINAPGGFGEAAAGHLARITGLPFVSASNKFSRQGSHDSLVFASGLLKTVAVSLYKIANDIRLLGSGPRCGFQELMLPANEPGSSIMPGKVNPTQCEAMSMAAIQVMGYDAAVAFAGAGGSLEMNMYKPVLIFNILQSIRLIADSCGSFADFCVRGMEPNRAQIEDYLNRSLMLVTALSPVIGYDKAAQIAHLALREGLTLREAALKLSYVSGEEFDRTVDPYAMAHPADR